MEQWPLALEPHFYIETCSKCEEHKHLYSNHSQEKYTQFAKDLRERLVEVIPDLKCEVNGKKATKVLINEYHQNMTTDSKVYLKGTAIKYHNPSDHDRNTIARAKRGKKFGQFHHGYGTQRYGFEVYFMGVKLFSKIDSLLWPNCTLLALKC